MLFNCIFIFCCLGCASLFPVKNCKTLSKRLLSVLDCRGEIEEQRDFMKTFFAIMIDNTPKFGNVKLNSTMMIGNKCSKNPNIDFLDGEFKYNETLPISSVLEATQQWRENEEDTCGILSVSFIYFFNIVDINNNSHPLMNRIVDSVNDNKDLNRFFIIQSSEMPTHNYSTMDFIHFTTSFKDLNIKDIFNKICDMKFKNTLSYSRINYVKTDYRIVNYLSKISLLSAICYCVDTHGMFLLSTESYGEFVDIIQYINNVSIANDTSEMNIFLNFLNLNSMGAMWISSNPYTFSNSSRITRLNICFYLNLSTYKNTILFHDKNLYNLGKYMVEIDCYEPLPNSLVVCEGDNVIPEIYYEQLNKKISSVKNIVALTYNHTYSIFKMFFKNISRKCNSIKHMPFITKSGYVIEIYNCRIYTNETIINETNNARNNYITLLYEGTNSGYTLEKFDISKCEMYNECQTMSYNEIGYELSNQNVDIFCGDDRKSKTFNDTCSIRTVNLNFTLEYVQCESNTSQYSLKCIKDYDSQCEDNSNLLNCEDFICPDPFIKCLNSYCIFPEMIRNSFHDCPYGEDEILEFNKPRNENFTGQFLLNMRVVCLDSNSFQLLLPIQENNTKFVCDNVCPKHYKCVSGKIEENIPNKKSRKISHLQLHIMLSLVFDLNNIVRALQYEAIINSHLLSIISFKGRSCSLTNFDYELQYWKFKDLIELDVSSNNINHSSYLKSVEQFSQLKLLNLSHNENLIIDLLFNFPRSLEIIDLSHTKIKALRNQVFGDLKNLKHLNLSHTLITKFKDMGLPEYYTLDTLYIQHMIIQHIDKDFFRGLTINSELVASDFVICCPQILNANISVDKCHAPVDVISSCKHLVGDTLKRIVIWIVGLLTIVGNGIVLVYRIGWDREIFKKAYGLFITGLSISDFFMGVYLISIAIVDAYYKDVYVLEDFQWRNGFICICCGFLSTLSSEASTFFVCFITVDRFLCITYPFGQHGFSNTGKLLSLALVWFVGCVLALIPVVLSDWEIYSSNGLCLALPLSPTQDRGWVFSFVVFVGLNFILFLFIAFGQLTIFINFIKVRKSISSVTQDHRRRSEDLSVAKKLAFVAFTNFCCWFPVGILGFLSFNGYIFNREVYAWIAVFVLPINSALNPIIYTIPALYSKCKTFIIVNYLTSRP